MSDYTTEVRYLCESYADLNNSKDYLSIDEILEKSCGKIFDFPFPIFDENYRKVLECKILKHYYTREICAETVGLWKLYLNRRMNEIMPYYNQLYKSELLEFNPLYDIDMTRESDTSNKGEKTNTSKTDIGTDGTFHNSTSGTNESSGTVTNTGTHTNNGTKWDLYSDTPQGTVDNIDNLSYLTNARKNTDNNTTTDNTSSNTKDSGKNTQTTDSTNKNTTNSSTSSNGTSNSTQNYLEHVQGKTGSHTSSKMLMEYRQTFLNIDMEIINKLEDLFFMLW